MLGCNQALSQVSDWGYVSCGSQARGHGGGPGLALPCPPPSAFHMLWAGSSWDTKASLSLGQTTGVRGMVGLATAGTGSCQEPASPPSWGGYWRIPSTWQGGVGGGARAYLLASSLAAGPGRPGAGSVNSPIFQGACLLPKAKQALPASPHPPGSGTHSQANHTTGLCKTLG